MTAVKETTPVLKNVRGPSALGGGFRRLVDLTFLLSVTEFKRTYFGTALGYLWSIARPLALFGVLLVVFTHVFRLGSAVPHYPVLLLFNLVIFGFFSEATGVAVTSISAQEGIVRKTQFPRIVIPLSVVLTAMFNLLLNLVVVFAFVVAFGVTPMWTWLLLPFVLIGVAVFTLAVSMIISSLYPRFRDVGIIWSVFSTALFYATPVLYPIEKAPGWLQQISGLNPITILLQLGRRWVIDPGAPHLTDITGGIPQLLLTGVIFVAICALAVWVFSREAPRIAEAL